MPKVAIIILNWNGWEMTFACLESLSRVEYDNFEVILVDNGSKEKFPIPNSQFPNLRIRQIFNERNLGFSGGNNVGISYALKDSSAGGFSTALPQQSSGQVGARGADFILLLNNDTIVAPDFLRELADVAQNDKRVGIVGPKIYYESEKNRIWFGGGIFSWFGGGKHLRYNEIDKRPEELRVKEIDYQTGCAFLIKREVIEKVGALNEDYFLYYEDTDWSLRARSAGYKIIYAPAAKVWHKVSATAKPNFNKIIYYYHIRNALLIAKLHAPKIILAGIYIWSFFHYLKQVIKSVILPSKREISRMIMRGIKDFYNGKFGEYKI